MDNFKQLPDSLSDEISERNVNTTSLYIDNSNIDIQVKTAQIYKRNLSKVLDDIWLLSDDKEIAEKCFYSIIRDGKIIRGASIRLAEIIISCYGNIRASSKIIANDGKTVTAQGMCWDLEKNVAYCIEVKRKITKKDGSAQTDDMVVIHSNACCAIALRNAIFKVVPEAITFRVQKKIKDLILGNISDFSTTRKNAIDYFIEKGITEKQILQTLDKKTIDEIDREDIIDLRGIATSIIDGDTTLDLAFQITPKNTAIGKSSRILATPLQDGDGDYEKTTDFRKNNSNTNSFTEATIDNNAIVLDKKEENLKKLAALSEDSVDLNDAIGKTVNSTEDNNNSTITDTDSLNENESSAKALNIAMSLGYSEHKDENTNSEKKNDNLDGNVSGTYSNTNFLNESEQKAIINAVDDNINPEVIPADVKVTDDVDNNNNNAVTENSNSTATGGESVKENQTESTNKVFDVSSFEYNGIPRDKVEEPLNDENKEAVRTKRPYNKKKKEGDVSLFTDNTTNNNNIVDDNPNKDNINPDTTTTTTD